MSENESYRYTPCKGQTAFILMQGCTVINIPIHGGFNPKRKCLLIQELCWFLATLILFLEITAFVILHSTLGMRAVIALWQNPIII